MSSRYSAAKFRSTSTSKVEDKVPGNVIQDMRPEADELRRVIRKMGAYDESLYEKLMQAREKGVLDVLHRVLDDDEARRALDERTPSILGRPLHATVMHAFGVLREVFSDLQEAQSSSQVYSALVIDGRAKYIGIVVVLFSVLSLLVVCMNEL